MNRPRDARYRQQPGLFDPSPAAGQETTPETPLSDPEAENRTPDQGIASRNETYREIAAQMPDRCRTWLGRIIAAGERGVTLDELSAATGQPQNAFSGRITELKRRGLVEHTTARRPTRKGSTAAVIVAVRPGRQCGKTLARTAPEDPMTEQQPPKDMPDADTCPSTPKDTEGNPLRAGYYLISRSGSGLACVQVIEVAETGELLYAKAPTHVGTHWARVASCDPAATWERVDNPKPR